MKYLWKYFALAIIFQTVCKSLSLFGGISMLSLFTSFSLTSWSWKEFKKSCHRLQNPTSHWGTTKKSSRHDEHAFESILRPHPIASRCLPAWHQVDKPQFPNLHSITTMPSMVPNPTHLISIHQQSLSCFENKINGGSVVGIVGSRNWSYFSVIVGLKKKVSEFLIHTWWNLGELLTDVCFSLVPSLANKRQECLPVIYIYSHESYPENFDSICQEHLRFSIGKLKD